MTSVEKTLHNLVCIALLGAVASAALAQATTPAALHDAAARSNRLIIKLRPSNSTNTSSKDQLQGLASYRERIQALNADPSSALHYLKSVSPHTHVAVTNQRFSHADLSALARKIAQDPQVEYAEVDERVYRHFVPNDSAYGAQQWNLKSPVQEAGGANLPDAWGRSLAGAPLNGARVTVAILDSGYRPHADLVPNIVPGYDLISSDALGDFRTANDGDGRDADALDPGDWNDYSDECPVENSSWHGTHIAGIIGAVGNNSTGIIGVAYGARILPVRVLGVCGGFSSDTAAGLQWAAGLDVPGVARNPNVAKVINLSFGRDGICSQTYQEAITAARRAGSVIVASTGNEYQTHITQPANCSGVLAVTAHDHTGTNNAWANIGPGTTLSAPGDSIYSTSNTGVTIPAKDSYDHASGTSYAAPHVAGVAALLHQIKPGISPDEVETILTSSARPHPQGTRCSTRSDCGAGLLDASKAVQTLLPSTTPAAPTASENPAAASGGGGGALDWLDVLAGMLVLLATAGLRRLVPGKTVHQQDHNDAA
ncbi:MAG: S8 family peptidase [Rhodoferax sp.]|nr:S8 family peptidase [Rhodoferax sp.]